METKSSFLQGKTEIDRLRRFNLIMGGVHLIQGILMLILAGTVIEKISEFQPTIVQFYIRYDSILQTLVVDSKNLFDLPFGILVASFLLISALAHALISLSAKTYAIYEKDLKNGINKFRWFEYVLSVYLIFWFKNN